MNPCLGLSSPFLMVVFWGLVTAVSNSAVADPPTAVSFARDIRPILSDRCFICHGPDTQQRASDLRLDDPASALELAIEPGSPATSELMLRILSEDTEQLMPPPDSRLSLSDREKELLRLWIEQGADFEKHWSFVPPSKPPLPAVTRRDWLRNEIDYFVLHKLELLGYAPAAEASRETLIRRLSLDLTGLPPTLAEIDAFVSDNSPTAYENLVDRLLAKRSFGERMAVDWLDLARYADTYGYQNDRYRAMWPWRDWVVEAFNRNLPYDQFIEWQLAGDLLPNPTQEQILATAFNRNHRQTNEGGSVEEEFRAEYVADRVNTFGAAFLGLTLECCRCHDHKYDPLSQRDYYSLSAFFNSIDESGLYSHFTNDTPTPALPLSDSTQSERLLGLQSRVESLERELAACYPAEAQFQAWRGELSDVRPRQLDNLPLAAAAPNRALREMLQDSLRQGLIGDYGFDELQNGKLVNRVGQVDDSKTSDGPELVAGVLGQALKFSGENNATLAAGGGFTRDQSFSISMWLKTPQKFPRAVVFHRSRAWTDAASHGYELLIEQGRLSGALIHFWPGNAIRVHCLDELPLNTWVHVAMVYDGSSRAQGLKLFIDGDEAEVEIVRDKLTREIHVGEPQELTLGQRFRDVGFKDGVVDELQVFDRQLNLLEVKLLNMQIAAPDNIDEYLYNVSDALLKDYSAEHLAEMRERRSELRERLAAVRAERSQLSDSIAEIMVMREEPQPRATYVLKRGAYDALGELVPRDVPRAILDVGLGENPNRLDLAHWLTNPHHPLTARVSVNRFWQLLFGRGIVSTSEDFGLQGSNPTHPELLDWLASTFVESGWDVKQLLKTIVMSATYRQQSNPTAEMLVADPENLLLARGVASRLSAEMIRDSALAASGLLVDQMGGPPVKPYQPEGLWEEKSGEAYQRDVGPGSRRRSLYTFWKRTSPPPSMMTFDASNREVCVVNRQTTMTPLQVLVLLNDPQLAEAAIGLAERAITHSQTQQQQLQFVFRSLCGRTANERELSVLAKLFEEQQAVFATNREAAKQLLAVGDHVPDPELATPALAALTVVAQGLMSYDEFVMKR